MQTLHFQTKPGNEELRRAVQELGLSAYRFVEVSADGLHYKLQEVDVQEELAHSTLTPSGDTWTVPTTITCHRCGTQYKGWQVVARKWFDNKPLNIRTEHCPNCPLESTDAWMAAIGLLLEPPTASQVRQPTYKRRLTAEQIGRFK